MDALTWHKRFQTDAMTDQQCGASNVSRKTLLITNSKKIAVSESVARSFCLVAFVFFANLIFMRLLFDPVCFLEATEIFNTNIGFGIFLFCLMRSLEAECIL